MKIAPSTSEERVCGWIAFALALCGLIGWLIAVWPMPARAQAHVNCSQFANAIGYFADLRDVRGDRELAVALARRRNVDKGEVDQAVIEREVRRMWKEGLPREDAMLAVYKRCIAQMGDLGAES